MTPAGITEVLARIARLRRMADDAARMVPPETR